MRDLVKESRVTHSRDHLSRVKSQESRVTHSRVKSQEEQNFGKLILITDSVIIYLIVFKN
jgi:hypothetical protein